MKHGAKAKGRTALDQSSTLTRPGTRQTVFLEHLWIGHNQWKTLTDLLSMGEYPSEVAIDAAARTLSSLVSDVTSHTMDLGQTWISQARLFTGKARTTIATALHWDWALVKMSLLFSRERSFFSFLPSIHFVLSEVCYCPSEAPSPSRPWPSSFRTHFLSDLPSSYNHLHFCCLIVPILLLFAPTDTTAGQSHRS
jgi:hypothetical protein